MAPPDALRSIDELTLARQRVLVRADFDVPLDASGRIASDRKLRAALPTINHAIKSDARVIIAAHLGSPSDPPVSLEPVAERLAELLGQEVYLPDECVGDAARKVVSDLREGQVCLLENLYFEPGEAQNDDSFARKLLSMCDVYVGEAFGAAHLTQASTVSLPRMMKDRGVGYRFKAELEGLGRVAQGGEQPFVGILGGHSLAGAQAMFDIMLRRCRVILVGGVVANALLSARSVDMKASVFEREQLALGRALLSKARDQKVELVLPVDVLVAKDRAETAGDAVSVGSIPDGTAAFDIGPRTLELFLSKLQGAKLAFWRGSLGVAENPTFSAGTRGLLQALAESQTFGVVTGDSVVGVTEALGTDVESKVGLVSAGGVASLAFIEGRKLPGALALGG
jgi:phosphoglycerate kinase